ncbi:hypothetical protein [Aureispira anguillae]|uniref:Uncharacterized protein n=1 Tax=Aureispira anguillae TaxID=2864201 RepID=A0A916DV53_9BACT|nr:hypothetical protein [Aureispira anguillae]BDS12806.1 hypothetical protein AsAng_0035310 [Aureispira anguillae]
MEMVKTLISGTFFDTNYDQLIAIFKKVLKNEEKIRLKHRVVGEEINYEDDLHEIYIFSLNNHKSPKIDDYNINSEYKDNVKNATIFLEELASVFQAENIKYEFEYNEVIGGVEGEEYELQHPDL